MSEAIDEATMVLERVARKTREWKDRGFIRQFIRNDSFGRDIVQLNSQLDTAMMKFQNTSMIHIAKEGDIHTQLLLQLINRAETVEALVLQIKENRIPQARAEDLMETIQQDMAGMSIGNKDKAALGKGLSAVSEASGNLPPLVDLTGQVRKLEPESVGGGSSSDVWKGVCWETRIVAIKGLREHRASPERVQRFVKEANLWRELRHDNVLPCFGLAKDQCPSIALISPWMENQSSVLYITKNPNCDRRRILRGTARGVDYLHRNGIVHGDLRGSNILIDAAGDAKICDFGLAAVGSDNIGSTSIAATAARWMAPEMMSGHSMPGFPSDVFSYGRTILEIMSGKKPFAETRNAFQIVTDVCNGNNPKRPAEQEVFDRGLNNEVWQFCMRCWQFDPEKRPSMQQVLQETEALLWAP
ncbi:kinase-like protein [Calocera cornea HHB12733]|uniref:Kinase-like protein n=1 Tax=Calocera cornea HHB12733 TaxID=1353952 RepID=A0A165JDJ8_9BASI|nr:kinase-like protein [Calocera cornea HHB12733]